MLLALVKVGRAKLLVKAKPERLGGLEAGTLRLVGSIEKSEPLFLNPLLDK